MPALSRVPLLLALLALPLTAQTTAGRGPRAERIALSLHLTGPQKASIQDIRAKHRPDLALRREAVQRAQTGLRTALRDTATPEAQLHALCDKAASARFELMLARRSVRQDIQAILTPEQRILAAELRGAAQERLRERRRQLRSATDMAG